MQGSALNTAKSIHENKSVQQLSPLPFISLLTNCVIWSLYGFYKKDHTVLVPNAIGIAVGAVSVIVYQKYSKVTPKKLYAIAGMLMLIAAKFALSSDLQSVGLLGCALAVIVSGSPLATIRTVLSEKSTAALPFLPSVFTWLNAFSWSCYGLFVAEDSMVLKILFSSLCLIPS
jgi:solute carrier family 50 protein (sugar transporter)